MKFTKESVMKLAGAHGGIQYLHCLISDDRVYIPCHNIEYEPKKGKKQYISRVGTEVFLEENWIKVEGSSEWSPEGETVWCYFNWVDIVIVQFSKDDINLKN